MEKKVREKTCKGCGKDSYYSDMLITQGLSLRCPHCGTAICNEDDGYLDSHIVRSSLGKWNPRK